MSKEQTIFEGTSHQSWQVTVIFYLFLLRCVVVEI